MTTGTSRALALSFVAALCGSRAWAGIGEVRAPEPTQAPPVLAPSAIGVVDVSPIPLIQEQDGPSYQLVAGPNDALLLSVGENGKLLSASAPAESGLTQNHLNKIAETLHHIDRRFVDPISPERWRKLIDKGLAAIADGLDDRYTEYFDQRAWTDHREERSGHMAGIGIVLDSSREHKSAQKALAQGKTKSLEVNVHKNGLRVKGTRKGSPAEAAGFQSGDSVIRLNGEKIAGRPLDEVMDEMRGPSGSEVKMTVSRGHHELELAATRAEIEAPLITAALFDDDIAYIYYKDFRPGSEDDFLSTLAALRDAGAKKVIIDLRGNPGGTVLTANNIMANLLPEGLETTTIRHRGEIQQQYQTRQHGPFAEMEKIVLIDGGSASASEMTAATLQDYGVAVVGPGLSYGKFSFQLEIPLSDDSGIKITGGRYHSGKGRTLPGRPDPKTGINIPDSGGVTPDVIVPMTKKQQRAVHAAILARLDGEEPKPVEDLVLDKALEIMRGRR